MIKFALPSINNHRRPYAAIILIVLGSILLGLSSIYFVLSYFAGKNPEQLVYKPPLIMETNHNGAALSPPSNSSLNQSLYPGVNLPARVWGNPRNTANLISSSTHSDFTPLQNLGEPLTFGRGNPADRLSIPTVGINANIEALQILELENSRSYETPKHVIGHIPSTPYPGAAGNGWYFGHLESPILGEGNVFAELVGIPKLLQNGEDVYIITESEDRHHLYLVTETALLPEERLYLYNSNDSRITLVTCFPRFKYDHRLIVTAQLIGFKEIEE
jgi:sortase (surface protein transpeptidase)